MTTLKVEHNLTDDELCKAVTGLAEASDISQSVIDTLKRSRECDDTPKDPRYPALKELYRRFRAEFRTAIRDIAGYADRADSLQKAIRQPVPLTIEQLKQLQQAIKDRFEYVAGQFQSVDYIPDHAQLERWKALGLISADVTPATFALSVPADMRLVLIAFIMGRLFQAVEKGSSYAELMHLAVNMPLLKPDLHAIAVAEQQTSLYITKFGADCAMEAGELWAKKQAATVKQMAIDYHGHSLQAKVLDREAKEALGMPIPVKQVDTWRGFSSELYHAMEDKARDWDRIAFYELTDAQKQGQAHKLIEDVGTEGLVYKRPLTTACAQCKFLYLEPDGVTPRVFRLSEMIENGINIGRKPHPVSEGKVSGSPRSDGEEALQAVTGLIHPWCQCQGVYEFTQHESFAEKAMEYFRKREAVN